MVLSSQNYQQYLEQVRIIAKSAGVAIMQIYSTNFDVVSKKDNSPLTQADLAAHHVIVTALRKLTPHIPVLSEESESLDYEIRKNWQQYWLIDPLDGTREFIKRNGEFTVNIALIDGQKSVLGVVYAPVTDIVYFASLGHGAYKKIKSNATLQIHTRLLNLKKTIIAGSRSHTDEKIQKFIHNLEHVTGVAPKLISMGSSLKICLVAEGSADVYPRLGLTSEWDTAAAHCVLTEAGGDIVDEASLTIRYNSKPSLLNPFFFAKSADIQNWADFM